MNLHPRDQDFIRLIRRSPDRGDGWRSVSEMLWSLVEGFGDQSLIETDVAERKVRFSDRGAVVAEYL